MKRNPDGPRLTMLDADSDVWVISMPAEGQTSTELTAAEQAVVQALISGASTKEIAESRGTAARTVANQIRAIFIKLGVTSRTELLVELQRRVV